MPAPDSSASPILLIFYNPSAPQAVQDSSSLHQSTQLTLCSIHQLSTQSPSHISAKMSTQGTKIEAAGATRRPGIQLYSPQYFAACTLGGIIGKSPRHSLNP
jgi:hypothetical protein